MSATRRSRIIAKSDKTKKSLKLCSKPFISRKCKLILTPLEHSPFKNMYFSLLQSQTKSAPNSVDKHNLNLKQINGPDKCMMDTITLVDINEIKNRPLTSGRGRKAATIKPAHSDDLNINIRRSIKQAITKFEKRFFLSFVDIETINFDRYLKVGPETYIVKTDSVERKKSSLNQQIGRKFQKTFLTRDEPRVKFEDGPLNHLKPQVLLSRTSIDGINYRPLTSDKTINDLESSKNYCLLFHNSYKSKFIDPYEPINLIDFEFDSIAFCISNFQNGISMPSNQWSCSLRRDLIQDKQDKNKVIVTYQKNGKQVTRNLFCNDKVIERRTYNAAQIKKLKCFDFRRYDLRFHDGRIITKSDRRVIIRRSGEYIITIEDIQIKLSAAPVKVKSREDIEILLDIIDRVSLADSLVVIS